VALPPESSSGICTFRTGRFPAPSEALLVRESCCNPSGTEVVDTFRGLTIFCVRAGVGGECGWFRGRDAAPTSKDWERLLEVAVPLRGGSPLEVEDAQC
jgi:hypothetical protein